jgi:ketosteroid isomerase-like protein
MIEHAQDSNHTVRQAYDGLARGDLPIFLNLLAPECSGVSRQACL